MRCCRSISVVIGYGKINLGVNNRQFLRAILYSSATCDKRSAHTQALTKNLQYITSEKVLVKADPHTMKLTKETDRPICIMLTWLLAPRKHTLKYASLYLERGFDVVSVSIEPWELMWPRKGAQLIGWDVLRLMTANANKFMVHGFSAGGYVWSETLVHAMKDLPKYQPVLDRVSAQVWDSVADIKGVQTGVPLALFPNSQLLQKTLERVMEFYLYAFRNIATKHYKLASETYYATPCRGPALFLLSSTDHVGSEKNLRNACKAWMNLGIKCTWQCWDRSPHVSHYPMHPEEYVRLLETHIRENVIYVDSRETITLMKMGAAA